MKKSSLYVLILLSVIAVGCGGRKGAIDDVAAYGSYFVQKLAANQIDSLALYYPDIAKAPYLNPVKGGEIMVEADGDNLYTIALSDSISIKVNRTDDGRFAVVESRGLFAFPAEKELLAKQTGLWDPSLNDSQLADRMSDEGFFEWLNKRSEFNTGKLISISDIVLPDEMGTAVFDGYQYLTNNTEEEIDGSDYNIIYHYEYGVTEFDHEEGNETKPGKTLPPGGKVKIDASGGYHGGTQAVKIKWNLSSDELKAKFGKPITGNEYQEYINSK